MVRRAEVRQRRYEAGINPEVIGARFGQVKEGMVRQEGTYFPQIALVEGEVKRVVEAAGVPTYEVAQYINVGRQCYSIAKRFSQATRDQEAQRVVDKWASRGLDGPLLVLACRAGGCEVEEPAAVCYNPCVHGADKHDASVLDTIVKWVAANIGKAAYDDLLNKWKVIRPALNYNWTYNNLGSGVVYEKPFYFYVRSGVTANSRALCWTPTFGMNSGDRTGTALDYSKRLEWHLIIRRINSDAEAVARIQMKQTSGEGDLASAGLGLRINNYTVLGEAYGSARQTVGLGTLIDDSVWRVKIVLVPGVRVEFWVNGVLTGTLTGTAVPVGVIGSTYIVLSIINGPTGGVDNYFHVGNMIFVQEW